MVKNFPKVYPESSGWKVELLFLTISPKNALNTEGGILKLGLKIFKYGIADFQQTLSRRIK